MEKSDSDDAVTVQGDAAEVSETGQVKLYVMDGAQTWQDHGVGFARLEKVCRVHLFGGSVPADHLWNATAPW